MILGDKEAVRRMEERQEAERQRIEALASEDVNKEIVSSLADIKEAATKNLGPDGAPNTMTLYRHAAFLAVLARKAETQAAKNLAIQDTMLKLTRRFLYVSIGLAVLQIVLPYLKPVNPPSESNHPAQQTHAQPLSTPIESPTPH
jgi:hypothetical protein